MPEFCEIFFFISISFPQLADGHRSLPGKIFYQRQAAKCRWLTSMKFLLSPSSLFFFSDVFKIKEKEDVSFQNQSGRVPVSMQKQYAWSLRGKLDSGYTNALL